MYLLKRNAEDDLTHYLYLIDGISVPKRIFERRKLFGEYIGADFWAIEIREKESQYGPRGH